MRKVQMFDGTIIDHDDPRPRKKVKGLVYFDTDKIKISIWDKIWNFFGQKII